MRAKGRFGRSTRVGEIFYVMDDMTSMEVTAEVMSNTEVGMGEEERLDRPHTQIGLRVGLGKIDIGDSLRVH